MTKLDKDTVLDNFTKAYTKANGNAPSIEAKGGWYSVDGGKNMRLAQLEEMTAELSAGASAKKEKTKSTDKKSADKKAAPAKTEKAPAKKAPAKKKKAASKTFSVKDFYTQQILETNPGAKAPR